MNLAGVFAAEQGDLTSARRWFEDALAAARQIGDEKRIAGGLANLGGVLFLAGRHGEARAHYKEALALSRLRGDDRSVAQCLENLACIASHLCELERARTLIDESLDSALADGNLDQIVLSQRTRGQVLLVAREVDEAARVLQQAVTHAHELGRLQLLADCLDTVAVVAVERDDPVRAATLVGAADSLRATSGAARLPDLLGLHERALESARRTLGGDDSFGDYVARGRDLSLDDVLDLARVA